MCKIQLEMPLTVRTETSYSFWSSSLAVHWNPLEIIDMFKHTKTIRNTFAGQRMDFGRAIIDLPARSTQNVKRRPRCNSRSRTMNAHDQTLEAVAVRSDGSIITRAVSYLYPSVVEDCLARTSRFEDVRRGRSFCQYGVNGWTSYGCAYDVLSLISHTRCVICYLILLIHRLHPTPPYLAEHYGTFRRVLLSVNGHRCAR